MAKKNDRQDAREQASREQLVHKRLRKKNIPVVTLDAKWHQLFPEKDKTPEIKNLEHQLTELLKLQGRVTNDLKELKKIRGSLTQDVLNTADDRALTEEKRQKRQETNQRLIIEARDKMTELEDEQLTLPQRIRDANAALIIECVDVCYKRIDKNRKDIEVLTQWIDETRIKLKKRILIKQDKETKNAQIYSYLHDLLGPEVMEVFDEQGD